MRQKAKTLLCSLLAAASLLLVQPAAYGQPPGVIDSTHYWTYRVLDPPIQPAPILVRDQFLLNYTSLQVDTLARLVNWVRKNNSQVRDTSLHFTWWNLQPKPVVNRTVRVGNQFGTYNVVADRLDFLLAPAFKNNPTPGLPELSHYTCYRASGFPSPGRVYSLVDEWRVDNQFVYSLEYLCNPCWKIHNAVTYPPIDTVTHLALYEIHPQSPVFTPFVRDQFLQAGFPVQQQLPKEYLLVPSTKTEVPTDAKKGTWGRVKVLYR